MASTAFAEADVARPDDLRIAFDRACAYAADDDPNKAKELFQKAALSRESQLAVQSNYNLGCLVAAQARGVFGQKPLEATAEQRSQGLSLLASAVGHYRDCLQLEQDHRDARHNLEVIRLWMKHMQALWNERDRQQTRDEMNLLQFLAMLESRQAQLRSATMPLTAEAASPKRRQTAQQMQSSQQEVTEEIGPLKEKIQSELQPTDPGHTGNTPQPAAGAESQQALELLNRLADETKKSMQQAADHLSGAAFQDAIESQQRVLDNLNQIYMVVAPFPSIVQKALTTQQALVDYSTAWQELAAEEKDADVSTDHSESASRQTKVAEWSRLLPLKAEAELKQLESQSAALDAAQNGQAVPGADPQAAAKQVEGLRASMNKAIELGPQAEALAQEAADRLKENKVDDAAPKQADALKLLKEIADPLPKQDQPDQNSEDDKPQQQNKDEQQQSNESQQQQQKQQQRRDLSREQAESVLRRVRERERKHREMQQNLQQSLASPVRVDRDW